MSASASVTVGGGSSSSTVSVASASATFVVPAVAPTALRTPWLLLAVAETVTCLSGASTLLSRASIVTVPVLVCEPAEIVSVDPLSVKSLATAGLTAAADTPTVVSSLDGRSSTAVTVVTPPFSPIEPGISTSVATGAGSSSRIVSVTSAGVPCS